MSYLMEESCNVHQRHLLMFIRQKSMSVINISMSETIHVCKQILTIPHILKRHDYKYWEYFYHTRYYIISSHSIKIKYISKERTYCYRLDGQRCDFCKGFHSFMLTNPHKNTQLFLLSSYCGLKLRYYYTLKSYEEHYKRTKVIQSLIKYARQIR